MQEARGERSLTDCFNSASHKPLTLQCTCEAPYSFVDDSLLRNFWNVVFWSSQALTWVIIPLTEAYFSAGDFSFGQKMKTSLRENAIVYGSALVIFFIVLVYISVKVCILLSFAEICR